MKNLKLHASLDDQINLLLARGLTITDREQAKKMLSDINYYRFSGYLFGFKNFGLDTYLPGITIENVKRIYDFDRKFTRILMYALEDIEETLKTRTSYAITSEFPADPLVYLKPILYRNYDSYIRFLNKFYQAIDHNDKLPFVKHHIKHYGGFLPMWVAVELFTMGNLHAVYDNLLPVYQKKIAKTYKTSPKYLSSWIENLTYTRNHLAHYMRIFDFNFGRTPLQSKYHHAYKVTSNMIFDQIYTMSFMYSDPRDWNEYVLPEIEQLLNEYHAEVPLSSLGFPSNWKDILTIS